MFEKCYDDFWQFLDLSKLTDDYGFHLIVAKDRFSANTVHLYIVPNLFSGIELRRI
jgi:hypothetical protein